jgi:hypothetical protein
MKGQWIGRTTGDQVGQIILNVDATDKGFSGSAFTWPDDSRFPPSLALFVTNNKNPDFAFSAATVPINPATGLPGEWEQFRHYFPEVHSHSSRADITGRYEENALFLRARTDNGIELEANIERTPYSDVSEISGELKSWEGFKEAVASLSQKKNLYRGQREPWKLRTAFHRRGRYNLFRFIAEDLRILHQRLTARTRHVFNLGIPDENGAFLNLAQHHGYPTPLLDWTYSPYAAAFFAFRNVRKERDSQKNVRIFIFDQQRWRSTFSQHVMLNAPALHVSVMEFLAIDNERLVPQQAATTLTNIDDIEKYLCTREEEQKCKYLSAIDIPQCERKKVISELSYMGITAGSMFPGLDGACEELREKFFDE